MVTQMGGQPELRWSPGQGGGIQMTLQSHPMSHVVTGKLRGYSITGSRDQVGNGPFTCADNTGEKLIWMEQRKG